MFHHILVPLDGSPLAECVLPHVLTLTEAFGARATLLRVMEPRPRGDQGSPVDPLYWRLRQAEAEAYLADVSDRLSAVGVDADTVILEGHPAQEIIKHVRSHEVDLVVLSSHGSTGVGEWNISSVSRKVIQLSRVSVLMVRAHDITGDELKPARYEKVLVTLDGSRRAEHVLPHATALARHQEAQLLVAHVVREPEVPRAAAPTQEDLELVQRLMSRNLELATRYFEELRPRLAVPLDSRILVGADVARAIHELSEQESISLLVMCAHGSSADVMRPYGSVSMSLVEYGTRSILVIQDFVADELRAGYAASAARNERGHAS
ncbi:MAG: universal stress protein [Anaerolineae bacterium]|nr:universal stress protein [Anaerolineae bacterium]